MSKSKKGRSIVGLAILFLGIVAGLFLIQNPQFLSSLAGSGTRVCRQVPKGAYQVIVTGNGSLNWALNCKGGPARRGKVDLNNTVSLGEVNLPRRILVGDSLKGSTTLSKLCGTDIGISKDLINLCAVCKLIDCDKVNIAVDVAVKEMKCSKPIYDVVGQGTVSVSGKDIELPTREGTCSISGIAKGEVRANLSGEVVISPRNGLCTQVITRAYNPTSKQCKDFATPCDIPDGWVTQDCKLSE